MQIYPEASATAELIGTRCHLFVFGDVLIKERRKCSRGKKVSMYNTLLAFGLVFYFGADKKDSGLMKERRKCLRGKKGPIPSSAETCLRQASTAK